MASTFRSFDPRTGEAIAEWPESSAEDIGAACRSAAEVARALARMPLAERAVRLHAMADSLEAIRADVTVVADRETGLGDARLQSEWTRTVAQCRAFADLVADGSFVEAIVDPPAPDAVPPRGDLRRMLVPIGPVANFAASNFPFAFSVPGTDTVAAIAAGCPVVVKAHPSHPETSRRCVAAIAPSFPPGAVSMVQGAAPAVGQLLVTDTHIRAVAFTGSLVGGRALFDLAAARPEPIPVFAEMGSTNPVFVTPTALRARRDAIADGLVASMLSGWGQFCTSPGVVVVPTSDDGDAFVGALADRITTAAPAVMLDERVRDGLDRAVTSTLESGQVREVARSERAAGGWATAARVLTCSADAYWANPAVCEEHFGPVVIVVRSDDPVGFAERIPGTLTATIHAEPEDDVALLLDRLTEHAGRVVWNGFPTGVAIAPAMHHGGPYPATTNASATSVGQLAVRRFLRPVTFQDVPDTQLPLALRDANPLRIQRLVDGTWTR